MHKRGYKTFRGVNARIEQAPTYHQLVIIITITFINSNLIIVASVCHFSACTLVGPIIMIFTHPFLSSCASSEEGERGR